MAKVSLNVHLRMSCYQLGSQNGLSVSRFLTWASSDFGGKTLSFDTCGFPNIGGGVPYDGSP